MESIFAVGHSLYLIHFLRSFLLSIRAIDAVDPCGFNHGHVTFLGRFFEDELAAQIVGLGNA